MKLLSATLISTLAASATLLRGAESEPAPSRLVAAATRAIRGFQKFNADNVALWERVLRAQRPWENDRRS